MAGELKEPCLQPKRWDWLREAVRINRRAFARADVVG
jgi:hypothetical protein